MTKYFLLILLSNFILKNLEATVTVIDAVGVGGAPVGGSMPGQMPMPMPATSKVPLKGADFMPTAQVYIKGKSCPFLNKDQDVTSLWQSTKDVLNEISREKERK